VEAPNDNDHISDDAVEDAVWESSDMCPACVAMKDVVQLRGFADNLEDLRHCIEKPITQPLALRLVPKIGLVDVRGCRGPDEQLHLV
jgi:hypothetical protein